MSGGNFGLAVAYAARELGHPATIFVPDFAPKVKIDASRALKAEVEVVAGSVGDTFSGSERRISETGALVARPYDQPEIVAGAGIAASSSMSSVPTSTPCWSPLAVEDRSTAGHVVRGQGEDHRRDRLGGRPTLDR